jgi:hypothetical protein
VTLSDAFKRAIRAIIRESDPRRAFANLYEYNVTKQDGPLMDATPAPSTKSLVPPVKLPPAFGVRMRPSITGGVASYPVGASVLVGFENGDPARPFVAFGDPDVEPELVVLQGGTNGVARKTDTVKVTIPIGTFLVAATGGSPNPAPVEVTGEITDGSSKVKVG